MDDLLTTQNAALKLGVSPSRVRQLVREGRLIAQKMGRDLLISRATVEAFALLPRRRTGRPKNN
jgi:excisionase family DNA binding protein